MNIYFTRSDESGSKKVGAKQGLQWIINGFYLFRKSPVTWILLCAILMSIAVILSSIQAAGQIIFTLLSPVFLAGLMSGCNALEQDKNYKSVIYSQDLCSVLFH